VKSTPPVWIKCKFCGAQAMPGYKHHPRLAKCSNIKCHKVFRITVV